MSGDAHGKKMNQTNSPLPLPVKVEREKMFSVYVSNLQKNISKVELEGIFFRAGRIVDIFIPVEKGSREGRGFAFVRFDAKGEAEKAVDLVVG